MRMEPIETPDVSANPIASLEARDWHERALYVARVAKACSSYPNPGVFVRRLYKTMLEALKCDYFSLYLVDAYEEQMVECASMIGMNAISLGGVVRMPFGLGRTKIIMRKGAPEIVDCQNPRQDEYVNDELLELGCRMLLAVPIVVESDSIGIYSAMYKSMTPIAEQDLEYALLLGDVIGSSISNIDWSEKWPSARERRDSAAAGEARQDGSKDFRRPTDRIREDLMAENLQLSDREWQIADLVAEGLSNQEIAERLFLSVGTVKKYISSLMQKVNATNRVQIASVAFEKRFLDGRMH